MTQSETYKKVYELVSQFYTKQAIDAFYRAFLKKFILGNQALCMQYGVPVDWVEGVKAGKKDTLLEVFAPFLAYGELFRAMRAALPEKMPAILDKIIWEGPQDYKSLEKEFGMKVAYTQRDLQERYINSAYEELNPLFCLFHDHAQYRGAFWSSGSAKGFNNKTSYNHTLLLEPPLCAVLKEFIDKPKEYEILPLNTIKPGVYNWAEEDRIFSELPLVLAYLQQGKLAVNDHGKAAVSSLNKMRKYCEIREFYPEAADKTLATVRTRLLAELLLMMVGKEKDRYADLATFIKNIFEEYQKNRPTNSTLLFHLKGMNQVTNETLVSDTVFKMLAVLPPMQWVSAANVVKYVLYREWPLRPFKDYDAGNYVYFEYEEQYGKSKQYIGLGQYQPLISEPLIRGGLFLFASFGLLDLAYNEPRHPAAAKFDRTYLSAFDGVKYVRLTTLGAYVCGLLPTFQAPDANNNEVLLDENSLFISYRGDNRSLQSVLEKIGKRAGSNENLYKVDYESLLGDCSTEKEIASKINLFKQLLSNNPPQLWKDFFIALQKRSYQLSSLEADYKVFKLPEDRELIRMFASDEFLKKHIIKAEMYYVLIPKGSVAKVKTYLKKFGFLVDFRVD